MEDAARTREEASSQHRSLSGYLLYVLERSFRVEETVGSILSPRRPQNIRGTQRPGIRTAVHLRCTAEEAARIREYARRRKLSLSDFVVFSMRRLWEANDRLRLG